MCIHSMCSTKFSYCLSLRMTPMGRPEQIKHAIFHVPGFGLGVDVNPPCQVLAVEQLVEAWEVLGACAHRQQNHER